MLSLPAEVLRQIPDGYRMWKLLQLTSRALDRRLEDYYYYKNIHPVCYNTVITRRMFVHELIESIVRPSVSDVYLTLNTNCVFKDVHSADDGVVLCDYVNIFESGWPMMDSGCSILEWNGHTLVIKLSDEVRLERAHTYDPYCILISDVLYTFACKTGSVNLCLRWIYSEIPELYRLIRVWRRIRFEDTLNGEYGAG